MTFYSRTLKAHTDGSPLRHTEADLRVQEKVARRLEQAWKCSLCPFGKLSPVDWYCVRHERMVGVAELKVRSHASDKHETVFLNVRKWLSLTMAAQGLGVPAVFVVLFTDGLRWINVSRIDARAVRMGGCHSIHASHTDREPVIEVPVASMEIIPS